VESPARALRYLTAGDPLLGSQRILHRANARYLGALGWAEDSLGLGEALWARLRSLPSADACFVLRSGGVRSLIDRLCEEASGDRVEPSAESAAEHAALEAVLDELQDAKDAKGTLDGAASGFDRRTPLTAPYPFVTAAWSGSSIDSPWDESRQVESRFQEIMATSVGAEPCALRPLGELEAHRIEEALLLLEAVDPLLPHEIAIHVRHACWIDYARWPTMDDGEYREVGQSVSSHEVPSSTFFSGYVLASLPLLAESLYHEALHKKLSNTIVAEGILRDGYDTKTSRRFHSYWNRDFAWNSSWWELDRALYAYHVYVHLYVYYSLLSRPGAIERAAPDGGLAPAFVQQRREETRERALALRDWLYDNSADSMTPTGVRFLHVLGDWMSTGVATPR